MNEFDQRFCELLNLRIQHRLESSIAQMALLRNAAWASTYRVLKNELDRPVGYLAWANLNKEAVRLLQKSGQLPQRMVEWDEGRIVVVTDVLMTNRSRFALRSIVAEVFKNRRVLIFVGGKYMSTYVRRSGVFILKSKVRRTKAP